MQALRYGTCYFPSRDCAATYYKDYVVRRPGWLAEVAQLVQRKVESGEIHIGRPPAKPGQTLHVEDNRWFVTEAAR